MKDVTKHHFEVKDLSGDPVYDGLKARLPEHAVLLGGAINEKFMCGPKEARITIVIRVKHEKTGQEVNLQYNYKKLERLYGI